MNKKSCVVCGETRNSIVCEYHSPDQYEVVAGLGQEHYYRAWVTCNKCGLYYSIYSRGDEVIDKLYETGYRSKDAPWRKGATIEQTFDKVTKLSPGTSETKKKVSWIKKSRKALADGGFIADKNQSLQFLDVGGGNGVFAYEFMDDSWQPFVVDPSEEGQFMRKHGINYTQAYFKPDLFSQKFDLITLNCVLEHLLTPTDILKIAKTSLCVNGLLYIEVPDAIHFDLVSEDDDIFNSCHLWMFDPHTIGRLLFDAGFQIYALERVRLIKGIGLWVLAGHQSIKQIGRT